MNMQLRMELFRRDPRNPRKPLYDLALSLKADGEGG
jgi:hypothetical protein